MRNYIAMGLAFSMMAFGTARAADPVGVKKSAPPPPAEAPMDWSGPYVGVHAGAVMNDGKYVYDDTDNVFGTYLSTAKYDKSLFGAGVYTGYNLQINSFVVGVEGDVTFNFGSKSRPALSDTDPVRYGTIKNDLDVTLRARLGYAFGNVLVYATGGLAVNDSKFRSPFEMDGTELSANKSGWVLGGGVEYAVTQNIVARLEFLHKDYGSKDRSLPYAIGPVIGAESEKVTFRSNTVRAGVAYKF